MVRTVVKRAAARKAQINQREGWVASSAARGPRPARGCNFRIRKMETFQVARPRTPTAVLELKGAFKKDPKRKKAREGEPVVEAPIGVPPKHIGEVAKSVWRRV